MDNGSGVLMDSDMQELYTIIRNKTGNTERNGQKRKRQAVKECLRSKKGVDHATKSFTTG